MKMVSKEVCGSLYALLSGILYGFVGYFGIMIIKSGYSVANMLFWRFSIASLIIIAIVLYSRIRIDLTDRNVIKVFITSIIFYSLGSALYFSACQYIGTGFAMVIFFIHPVFVTLIIWLQDRHKISFLHYLSITSIIIGLVCLLRPNQIEIELHGILIATLASIFYAIYIVLGKKQVNQLPPILSTLIVCFSGSLLFSIIACLEGDFKIPNNLEIWQLILGIVIISTVLPILFLLKSLKYISATKASILSVLEPIVVLIIGVIVLKEEATMLQFVGAIIILIGALMVNLDKTVAKKL